VRWILNHHELSQSELKRLELILDTSDSTSRLQEALVGERCMVLDVFHQKSRDILETIDPGSENGLAVLGLYWLKATGKLKQDEIRFLDRMSEFRETLRLPLPERLDRADELRENISREAVPKKFILTGTMAPGFLKGIDRAARDLARKRSVEIALALEHYCLNRRKYPSALSELVPEYLSQIPNDPFGDEPMHYSGHERGYTIYSVGPDRIDDGGLKAIRESPLKDTPTGDIIFAINR
jgi:hypothetical protein